MSDDANPTELQTASTEELIAELGARSEAMVLAIRLKVFPMEIKTSSRGVLSELSGISRALCVTIDTELRKRIKGL